MKKIFMVGVMLICLMFASCDADRQNSPSQSTACEIHTYGEWQTVMEATCYDTGVEKRDCAVCGETETRTVNAKEHRMGFWVKESFII